MLVTAGYGSSKARGLPGGVKIEDLLVQQAASIPSVSDRNPDVECEFFHTRQVGSQPPQLCLHVLTHLILLACTATSPPHNSCLHVLTAATVPASTVISDPLQKVFAYLHAELEQMYMVVTAQLPVERAHDVKVDC